jgi:hypothetical protein
MQGLRGGLVRAMRAQVARQRKKNDKNKGKAETRHNDNVTG